MGRYNYDESGNMATYFVLTFLAIGLVPLSISSLPSTSTEKITHGCQCTPCTEQRVRIRKRERRSILKPKLGIKALLTLGGWALFTFLSYNASKATIENKVYDPFEILGLGSSSSEKEIRSHYKKLSKQFHPDKVQLAENQTMASVELHFVGLTKAYKALTDETIRENLRKYGHPDGQQETTMGIALPPWIVAAQNNIWVLGVYGVLFGGILPYLVGSWWFGSQKRTKDGVDARSAADFFKVLREESEFEEVIGALAHAVEFSKSGHSSAPTDSLEGQVKGSLGERKWAEVVKHAEVQQNPQRKKALVLLYAHLLRIPVDPALENDQTTLLLQLPNLLNAVLSISLSRNWLLPSLAAMRLHAFITQALPPRPTKNGPVLSQLPQIKLEEEKATFDGVDGLKGAVERLQQKGDSRATEVQKALADWGRVEVVDTSFKVIDERIVTPASIVYLVAKLRLKHPTDDVPPAKEEKEEDVDVVKRRLREDEAKDYAFLTSKKDAEDTDAINGWAHAPYWPSTRKPSWWLVLADDKSGRVVVPPMKINDIPFTSGGKRDYRSYKLQFQAPQGVGVYTWKLYVISDTFVGEEVSQNITLKIDDPAALTVEEQGAEDDISDPDEDTLAGQMAALRGGKVKRSAVPGDDDDDDDEDSETDEDDSDSDTDSSSDDD